MLGAGRATRLRAAKSAAIVFVYIQANGFLATHITQINSRDTASAPLPAGPALRPTSHVLRLVTRTTHGHATGHP
eukprot:3740213-Prymnesium_polylepis.1